MKKFWMSTFISSDCTTTLPGQPAEKKRHTPAGKRAPSVFVKRPKLVADYYNGMPGTDIVNRNAQFLIGIETAIRSRNIHKRMCCTVLGTWMANAYGMAMRFLPRHRKSNITTASFVREVILEGFFEQNRLPLQSIRSTNISDNQSLSTINNSITATSNRQQYPSPVSIHNRQSIPPSVNTPTLPPLPPPQNEIAIGGGTEARSAAEITTSQSLDPYIHTMQRCSDEHTGSSRQQRCVMCNQEGRRIMTSFYCSLCCVTSNREEHRRPSKHAYCINPKYNCFSRHIAKCYHHMNQNGIIPQRNTFLNNNNRQDEDTPMAGRIINRNIPTSRRSNRRQRRSRV